MAQIKTFVIAVLLLHGFSLATNCKASTLPTFRFHIVEVPQSFDPAQFHSTEPNHFFSNIYRGLFKYDNIQGIVPEGAEKCVWTNPKKLNCTLRKNFRWSDGTPVKAEDYVRAFRYLVDPQSRARTLHGFMKLQNAKEILLGKMPSEKLGVVALGDFELEFLFSDEDPEFIARLTSSLFVPWKTKPDIQNPEKIISDGPYMIKKYDKYQKVLLVPNPYYPLGNPDRPNVEIYFVDDDATAQNLFDIGKTDLQMRLDFSFIPKYKNKKSYFEVPLSRFDYIGFGPDIQKDIHMKKALALSVDYKAMKKIVFAKGNPGCPGLTDNYIFNGKNNLAHCYVYNLDKAKKELKKASPDLVKKRLSLKYSLAGGTVIKQIAEWYQQQWKKNLGLTVDLQPAEQGMYLSSLRTNTPDIFRKGINMDRPTCASALESFASNSADNFIHFSNKRFDSLLDQMSKTKDVTGQKKLCGRAVDVLMSEYSIIPQGLIYFGMLKSNRFNGFTINELYQLDLSNLRIQNRD